MKKLAFAWFLVFAMATSGWALSITFEYDIEFSGATPPAGSAPWLTATFDDGDTSGSVTLTMSTSGLIGSEFVSGWYFNFDPTYAAGNLVFVYDSGVAASSIAKSNNTYKADGDGYFDILFSFQPNAFSTGLVSVYTITGFSEMTADWFNFMSSPTGPDGKGGSGHGPFLSAAHVQGIGEDSGWVAPGTQPVPEPATLILLGSGLAGLALAKRRKKA